MKPINTQDLPAKIQLKWDEIKVWSRHLLERHWTKVILLGGLYWILQYRDITINLSSNQSDIAATTALAAAIPDPSAMRAQNVSLLNGGRRKQAKRAPAEAAAEPKPPKPVVSGDKRQRQADYIKKYARIARAEMSRYGIPASITLAQGLLESNVGTSKLAVENNNHFGIKCFSRTCHKGHCSNFTDDSHKDFFRKYTTVADSYRAHSLLLKQARYRSLFKLKRDDFKSWARGLKRAGYATDQYYGEKLINLIEDLRLHQYDR